MAYGAIVVTDISFTHVLVFDGFRQAQHWRKADIVLLQHVAPVSTLLLSKGDAQGISHGWPIGLPELSIRELPIQPHHSDKCPEALRFAPSDSEIGRASCRERVCQYVKTSVFADTLKNKQNKHK